MLAPGYSALRGELVGRIYNETAFRHFLAVDRWRAARSRRSVLLVLVAVRRSPGLNSKLTDATAAALFRGLSGCIREVDFLGWFRQGYVAAAVLPQGSQPSASEPHLVAERIRPAIKERLSVNEASSLRLRVIQLDGRATNLLSRRELMQ